MYLDWSDSIFGDSRVIFCTNMTMEFVSVYIFVVCYTRGHAHQNEQCTGISGCHLPMHDTAVRVVHIEKE